MSKKKPEKSPEAEKLTESEIDKAFEIVKGFNMPAGESPEGESLEKRFEAGTADKPHIVFEKDFEPEIWKALVQMEAIKPVEKPETEDEKDEIVFEKVEA